MKFTIYKCDECGKEAEGDIGDRGWLELAGFPSRESFHHFCSMRCCRQDNMPPQGSTVPPRQFWEIHKGRLRWVQPKSSKTFDIIEALPE